MPGQKSGVETDEQRADRLVFREDDESFKRRLNSAIQLGWVTNTAIAIIVCITILYLLDVSGIYSILLGVLLALLANFYYTLSQVTKASRWEVYRNRVVMPKGMSSGHLVIWYEDIEVIARKDGHLFDLVVIKLHSGERIRVEVKGQESALQTLFMAYRQYSDSIERSQSKISIPISSVE
jgi:hypothetical protein